MNGCARKNGDEIAVAASGVGTGDIVARWCARTPWIVGRGTVVEGL